MTIHIIHIRVALQYVYGHSSLSCGWPRVLVSGWPRRDHSGPLCTCAHSIGRRGLSVSRLVFRCSILLPEVPSMDPYMVALSGQGHVRSIGHRIERDLVAPWPTKLSLKKRLTPGYIAHWWTMVDAALASRDLLDHVVPAPTTHDDIGFANPTASAHEVNIVYNTAMTTRAVAQAHAARALFALTDHSEIGMSDTKKVQDWVAAGDGTSVYNYLISMTDTESYSTSFR